MPQLSLAPLDAVDGIVAVRDDAGVEVCSLHARRLSWRCSDAPLQALILSAAPPTLPDPEPSEPVPGALARLQQVCALPDALVTLLNPAAALGRARIGLAHGLRLIGIGTDDDEACWDAALSGGQVHYGVRGTLRLQWRRPRPPSAQDLLLVLAYGDFVCEEGLRLAELEEGRGGVRWRVADGEEGNARVIVRHGFEAAVVAGAEGAWQDRGTEAYVRLVVEAASGRCWTQPRLVMPMAGGQRG